MVLLFVTFFAAPSFAAGSPHPGDHFSYRENINLGNGYGDYDGYSESTIVIGNETMNGVDAYGIVSADFAEQWVWSNNTITNQVGGSSGNFTFSSNNFLYLNGTDDQTGYVNPSVWFCMDPSIPVGSTFYLLNTQMTVISGNYSYYLSTQGRSVETIYAHGASNYERNDEYGMFTATYTWDVYFDPATGYIAGYNYVEQNADPYGTGFTYSEDLAVDSTSYPLTTAAFVDHTGGDWVASQDAGFPEVAIIFVVLFVAFIVFAISRARLPLQQHPPQPPGGDYYSSPAPPTIDLTPNQPPVQQIVIKEVVKVNCKYCGTLIDSTAEVCPRCGAPRT